MLWTWLRQNSSHKHIWLIFFKPLCKRMLYMFEQNKNDYWLSSVDRLKSSGDFVKRRSLRRFFSPALFHQSQDAWMHALAISRRKWRSIEWSTSVLDSLNDHCIEPQQTYYLPCHLYIYVYIYISLFARWQHTTNNRKHTTKHTYTHLQTCTHKQCARNLISCILEQNLPGGKISLTKLSNYPM